MSLESVFSLLLVATCVIGVAGIVQAVREKLRELAEREAGDSAAAQRPAASHSKPASGFARN